MFKTFSLCLSIIFLIDIILFLYQQMPTTCLICCQQEEYFLLPPCNHKQMCWKCCIKLIQGSTFTCPYCNGTPEGTSCILFVDQKQMEKYSFQEIMKRNPFKSAAKQYQYYSNENVGNFIEQQTSFFCRLCSAIFDNMNYLKKHLNEVHRKQFCTVCLQNRKCLLQQQYLYNEGELTSHMKKGQYSHQNQLLLYHPYCDFCRQRFYDLDAFRAHLRMSSHLKCQICDQNFPKYKYVYYKDYSEIEKHFYKSHFVCETGNCIGNKLQNVFVSQALLQEHRNRYHNKGGKVTQKQVLNLLLFDAKIEQEMEWDRIGKDFSKQFISVQKQNVLKNEEHRDSIVDIRAFYPQQILAYNKLSLQQIKEKLFQHLYRPEYKSEVINFTSVPIFSPLEMSSCNRVQLQRFLRDIFDPKYSQPMIQTFFTRKFDYRSEHQYFSEVKRRMWSFSPISYYYVFPQLVRYFKESNKTKWTMDNFYSQSLRSLRINRVFIFHKKQHYTDILNILHEQIQSYIYDQMMEQKISLDIYAKYLKDLNPQFYQNNHQQLFYVQKEKIKNIYHMVQKTKINQLLKMNWLLKLGLSNASYKQILSKFYYKTLEECGQWVKFITIQQLALVYAYVQACLQSLIDKNTYNINKENSHTLFLGTVLSKIKVCIPSKQLTALKQIQQKSVQLAAKLNSYVITSNKKGVVINEEQHPSLLSFSQVKKTENEQKIVIFGQQVNITTNNNNRAIKKNGNHNNAKTKEEEQSDFPQLVKPKIKQKNVQKTEEQDFPVFNYRQSPQQNQKKSKALKHQDEDDNKTNIQKMGLFNPKNAFISQKITEQFYQKKQQNNHTKNEFNSFQRGWSDEWPTLDQQKFKQQPQNEIDKKKSTKKRKKKNEEILQSKPVADKIEETIPDQFLIKKKTKQQLRAQEELRSKKLKGKKIKQQQELNEEKSGQVKKRQKRKVRLDATDSEQQVGKREQQKKKEREEKHRKFVEEERLKQSLKYHDGFDSLLSEQKKSKVGVSIINSLIESSRADKAEPQIKIKKGKKGKAVLIEKVDIWKL